MPGTPGFGVLSNEAFANQTMPGVTNVSPSTTITSRVGDPEVIAGTTPLWRAFQMGDGMEIVLPGGVTGDAAEVLESLAESPWLMAITAIENRRRYGRDQWDAFTSRYFPGLHQERPGGRTPPGFGERLLRDIVEIQRRAGRLFGGKGGYTTRGGF